MQWRSLLPALLLLLIAQHALAGLRGTVYDVNGKALPKVRIVVQQPNKAPLTLMTNSEGQYLIPRLVPGTYTATFSVEGYETQRFRPILIHDASEELLLDARLWKNEGLGKTIATIHYTPRPFIPERKSDEPALPLTRGRCGTYVINSLAARNGPGIAGVLKDERHEPVPGASVTAMQGGIIRGGAITDFDGNFIIKPLDGGMYDVKFSYAGKEQTITSVRVSSDAVSVLNHRMVTARDATSGKEVVVRAVRYGGKPLIDPRTPGGTAVKNLTDITEIGGAPQTYQAKNGGALSLSGGRVGSGTIYVVDGVELKSGDGSFTTPESRAAAPASAPAIHAGMLTSGEINDFSKWTLWEDLSMDALKDYRNTWHFRPEARYTVLVKSANDMPLCNARVQLSNGSEVWEAMTDNTGKAELWYGLWDAAPANKPRQLSAAIDYGGQHFTIPSLKPFAEGVNILPTKIPCLNPAKLDIAFLVDATGSMEDEINYLKAELRDILQQVKDSLPALQVQTGAVFYRDLTDAYMTRSSDLTADFRKTEAFIANNNAAGGGDTPEAVDEALEEGLGLQWRDDAIARLAFLVLDAPPHQDAATVKRMQELVAQYAARGIRLIPVVCSGSDKSTEYLMRSMALATNGTYLFLTDHSHIGGSHTAPTTDQYDVEYLNGLIYRVIYNCAYMPACAEEAHAPAQRDTLRVSQAVKDNVMASWRYYPNPTSSILHIEHTHTNGYLLITDIIGKAILRIPTDASGHTQVDMSQYPSGIYTIRYNWADDQWIGGKFTVVH